MNHTVVNLKGHDPKHLTVLVKMLEGTKVELTPKGKEFWCEKGRTYGRWYFISAIRNDEVTLVGTYDDIFEGVSFDELKL